MLKVATPILTCVLLTACGARPLAPSTSHIRDTAPTEGAIPAPLGNSAMLLPPKPSVKAETYSVAVHNVSVQSLLFALARDAKLNVDVHPGISGQVTLNALDQTMPQLLARISKQVDMRYEIDGPNLIVRPDTPYLRNYRIDYVNMARDSSSTSSIATQISTTGASESGGGGGGSNNSTTSVSNTSNNRFWETLVQNIRDTLHETDKILADTSEQPMPAAPAPAGNGKGGNEAAAPARAPTFREAASVIANPETGLIAVRATSRQHEKIQEFIDMVMSSARRQVMIEATVIEVQLSDNYQQGINWSSIRTKGEGLNVIQGQVGTNPLPSNVSQGVTPGVFVMNYLKPLTSIGNLTATVQLLESFGKVKVLSSPKVSVLNNQTALLKVVDNKVYFTITATTTDATVGVPAKSTYTSELHTVPVGFVMSVTPQVAESDEVTLNVRPTISRIVGYVQDPSPALAQANVVSNVPVIQTREMESILRVASGNVAVMGGLMQDSVDNLKDGVPLLSRIPGIGDAFAYRNEKTSKSELVIFIRPVVIKEASMNGDFRDFRSYLPDNTPPGRPPYGEPRKPAPASGKPSK
ncbi:pilus (MSHA type) biogenesis protein MshL [Massilia sp. CF038]|uniref:pilus (MSHA type) biogenesis protein MshL n=1 Tax=Massilia sp. CF038 TaxID=1881045 RepID=UPI00091A2E3A|nr:pilus (MSHA type) biogenesis protein MshL [Massilia sp. CF038]SHG71244.1 general secretion pathway protein D [Massilia sp. CF038]